MTPPTKPLRADARRNRARILAAAESVFTNRGTSASTEEIAREAGVGIGTVFRHFPTKEALLEAIIVEHLRRLAEEAEALCASDEPGTALCTLFTRSVEQAATKLALTDALAHAGVDVHSVTSAVKHDLHAAIEKLLARAQQAGAVRHDVQVKDLMVLMVGTSRALEHGGGDRDLQARTLRIIFDGLRPSGSR